MSPKAFDALAPLAAQGEYADDSHQGDSDEDDEDEEEEEYSEDDEDEDEAAEDMDEDDGDDVDMEGGSEGNGGSLEWEEVGRTVTGNGARVAAYCVNPVTGPTQGPSPGMLMPGCMLSPTSACNSRRPSPSRCFLYQYQRVW